MALDEEAAPLPHRHPRDKTDPFRCFNSSPEVIRLVVMMYVRFPLSLRNVEDLLFEPAKAGARNAPKQRHAAKGRKRPSSMARSKTVSPSAN